jgi:acetolactate synthase-1/2/3 large subunit
MRVTDAIGDWFAARGIEHYFGYSGAAALPILDGLVSHPEIEAIQPKHESHAVHMADAYYRVTGRLAPVIVTKGPGILNCVGALATAMYDTSAVLVICGGGPTHHLGKSMQELTQHGFEDVVNVLRPVVKRAWFQVRPDTVMDTLNQAYKIATTGRPGPVFVQLPLDVVLADVEGEIRIPKTVTSRMRPDADSVAEVVELLEQSDRPFLLAGGGIAHSPGAAAALKALVEEINVPVATTLPAKGAISEDHPLSMGPVGRSGSAAAAEVSRQADLVIAIGARFADNNTSNWRAGKIYDIPGARVVQVDVDVAELGRTYPVDVGMLADAEAALTDLLAAVRGRDLGSRWMAWLQDAVARRDAWEEELVPIVTDSSAPTTPARLMHEVGEAVAETGRVFIDIGDSISYSEPYMRIRRPGSFVIAPGFAEMGSGSTAVLGAAVADPSQPAIAVTGDGAFNMTSAIVATAVEYSIPAVWVIVNNYELGIERKASELLFNRAHPWGRFRRKDTGEPYNPDYVKLADAYGALGERIENPDDLRGALERAIASGRPYVLDVPTDTEQKTYFVRGVERTYPDKWGESYPQYSDLRIVRQ